MRWRCVHITYDQWNFLLFSFWFFFLKIQNIVFFFAGPKTIRQNHLHFHYICHSSRRQCEKLKKRSNHWIQRHKFSSFVIETSNVKHKSVNQWPSCGSFRFWIYPAYRKITTVTSTNGLSIQTKEWYKYTRPHLLLQLCVHMKSSHTRKITHRIHERAEVETQNEMMKI